VNKFPVREIALEWDRKFGGTDGCEEKAYLAGAKAALEWAASICWTGRPLTMLKAEIMDKVKECEKK